ncbi:MAG: hypothetical protein AMXMBFR13_32350 [Phycisphaerae bacterium]
MFAYRTNGRAWLCAGTAALVYGVLAGPGAVVQAEQVTTQPAFLLAQADPLPPSDEQVSGQEVTQSTAAAPAEEEDSRTPLMRLFDAAGIGQGMDELGLNAFGWVETSFTGIFTGPGGSRAGLPLRVYESRKPDNLKMNQLAIVLERAYDSEKDIDFGFRVDPIFGADSRLNASVGLLDEETHTHSFDLAQFYAQLWIKTAQDQGLEITFGKWYTTVGAEVIPSPLNWLPTRTMLFGYGPFTHTGLLARYYIDNWNFHLGVSRGWDQFKDNNHGASWHAGFGVESKELCGEDPRSALSFAYIGGPEEIINEYGGQNRHIWNAVWTYRWTQKLTQVIDSYFAWEDDFPDAVNERGKARRRDSSWYGIAYMLNYQFNDCLQTTGRFEWFGDNYGVRTGYAGNFFSLTAGLGYTPFPNDPWLKGLIIRPELRWDFSANNEPFVSDDQQFTGTLSVVYAF